MKWEWEADKKRDGHDRTLTKERWPVIGPLNQPEGDRHRQERNLAKMPFRKGMVRSDDSNGRRGGRGSHSQGYIILNKTVLKLNWCKKVTSYIFFHRVKPQQFNIIG